MSIKTIVIKGFSSEKVSADLLSIIYWMGFIGAALVVFGLYGVVFQNLSDWIWYIARTGIGFAFIGTAFAWYNSEMKDIPNSNPPQVGLLSIWGDRMPVIVSQGKNMAARFFPFYIDYLGIPIESSNFDFPMENVLCASSVNDNDSKDPAAPDKQVGGVKAAKGAGASVSVKVSLTIFPDTSNGARLIKYLNNGGMAGVKNILQDQVSQSVREIARKYDWQKFTALKEQLTIMLLAKIADIDFRDLPRGADGLVSEDIRCMFMQGKIPEEYKDKTFKEVYATFPIKSDPIHQLFPELDGGDPITDTIELRRNRQEMEIFLKVAREFRFADVMDLGVEIFRLNITHMDQSAEMKAASNKAEQELQERIGETREVDTNLTLIKKIQSESKGEMGFKESTNTLLLIKGLATKQIVETGNALTDAAALLSGQKK